MKVLFSSHSARALRTTLLGHLFEIAQRHLTVLVSENLDPDTAAVLARKELFPRLERVIAIPSPAQNYFAKHRALESLAKHVVSECSPDIVIVGSDLHSLFERYLCRCAKRAGATVVAIQPTVVAPGRQVRRWLNLEDAYTRWPQWLPKYIKLMLTRVRKLCAHIFEYIMLPLLVGEAPFWGFTSHILWFGASGMRDADFQIVFSKRDWEIYRGDGVPPEKLYILSHPFAREARRIFAIAYLEKVRHARNLGERMAVVFLPGNVKIGFREDDKSLISQQERWQEWEEFPQLMREILIGWKILVQLHPDTPDKLLFMERLESLGQEIVVPVQGYADVTTEQADIIVGFPLSTSTTLFTASLQCPGKPILSLNFAHEFSGDIYKDFDGIEYIDNKEKFLKVLEAIRAGRYVKPSPGLALDDPRLSLGQFSNTIEMVEYLSQARRCPSCRAISAQRIGEIPPTPIPQASFLFYSSLYECPNCYLRYRWPRLDQKIQERLYKHPEVEYLKDSRRDWDLVRQVLQAHTGEKSILELGCFDGEFLGSLGSEWQRYGIEINPEVAARAMQKGITIVGRDFHELSKISQKFSVVLAIDVLEHSEEPERLLQDMLEKTLPGGLVILSTGNTSSWSWRLMKGRYWYCMFPGHISFVGEQWCKGISKKLNVTIVRIVHFSHGGECGTFGLLADCIKNLLYRFSPRIFGTLRRLGWGGIDIKTHPELQYHPPSWRSAKDHLLVVLQKPL